MDLFKASHQWASRPADERFASLQDMLTATQSYRNSAVEADVKYADIRTEAKDGEVLLRGPMGGFARMTNWAFKQLATRAGTAAQFLTDLPATLASQVLNHKLSTLGNDLQKEANVLLHRNGTLIARAIMSERYERIWNSDIVAKLVPLQSHGWRVPPARPAMANQPGTRKATAADVLEVSGFSGLSIKIGDDIAPAGLYASDRDMFAFMINEKARVKDGSEHGLSRGFFVQNNEVGSGSYVISTFLLKHVCGNHIVWGARISFPPRWRRDAGQGISQARSRTREIR
jgi:hypothetical protein